MFGGECSSSVIAGTKISQEADIKTDTDKKRHRSKFTSNQLLELERAYEVNKYVDRIRCSELASAIKLTEKQITTWFWRKRSKSRKEAQEQPCQVSFSHVPSQYTMTQPLVTAEQENNNSMYNEVENIENRNPNYLYDHQNFNQMQQQYFYNNQPINGAVPHVNSSRCQSQADNSLPMILTETDIQLLREMVDYYLNSDRFKNMDYVLID